MAAHYFWLPLQKRSFIFLSWGTIPDLRKMYRRTVGDHFLPVLLFLLPFMLPLCVDGFVQLKTSYESTNIKRVVTGFFFGYGLFMLFVVSAIFAYEYGHSLGEMLR